MPPIAPDIITAARKNTERALNASAPDDSLYYAIVNALIVAAELPGDLDDGQPSIADQVRNTISGADEWHQNPGPLASIAALHPLVHLIATLNHRAEALDARQRLYVDLAQTMLTKYSQQATPRRRRIRWPRSRP